jgi:hypothetical protein
MAPLLKDQIDEWARSEFGKDAMEFARKLEPHGEDALSETLIKLLQKGGEQTSPYPDLKDLHNIIITSLQNRRKDMFRHGNARWRWHEERGSGLEDSTSSDHSSEMGHRQENANALLLDLVKRSKPIEQIVLLVDKQSVVTVSSSSRKSDETDEFDPSILLMIKEAAAQLEPPIAASEVEKWRTLEDVARSLNRPSASLRSIKKRLYAKYQQQSLEDLGASFEKWNNLVS